MHPKYTPSSPSKPTLDPSTLVEQLNTLLNSLNVPIPLISPTDLTPSLLIAILESILDMRIPLIERSGSVSGREAHELQASSSSSRTAKVQNMKVFLGVLETDIIKRDVGLSELDPRRLADGEWDEVLFVAELLCWVGRRMGYILKTSNSEHSWTDESTHLSQRRSTPKPKPNPNPGCRTPSPPGRHRTEARGTRPPPLSPKSQLDLDAESLFQTGSSATGTRSTTTKRSQPVLSPFLRSSVREESITSLHPSNEPNGSYLDDEDALSSVSDILGNLSPFKQLGRRTDYPHCIHEVDLPTPSLLFSQDTSLVPTSPLSLSPRRPRPRRGMSPERATYPHDFTPPPFVPLEDSFTASPNTSVRFTGYIEPVDEDLEVASFELSRSMSSSVSQPREKKSRSNAEAVKSQYSRTLELLNERARLLTQLAELKNSHG